MTTFKTTLDFVFRVFVLVIAVTLGVMFLFAGARAALAATLKPVAVLTEDVLTVGDIFQGLSNDKAAYVLGPAPQPGHDMVLNSRTLMRVALTMNLPWRPAHSAEQVTVRRAATIIDADMITDILSSDLQKLGVNDKFTLSYAIPDPQIVLPHNMTAEAEITAIDFNPQTDKFEATLASPSRKNPLTQLTVAGKVERQIAMPVLRSALRSGDIIGQNDIETIYLNARDVQQDFILSADDLIGKTPRRMAMAGKPISVNEIQQPRMISRGEVITLVYDQGPMLLTAKGKAMQHGAHGDIVTVVNLSSNRTIQGLVSGQRQVTVQ